VIVPGARDVSGIIQSKENDYNPSKDELVNNILILDPRVSFGPNLEWPWHT
jgi:hypothetical protein